MHQKESELLLLVDVLDDLRAAVIYNNKQITNFAAALNKLIEAHNLGVQAIEANTATLSRLVSVLEQRELISVDEPHLNS